MKQTVKRIHTQHKNKLCNKQITNQQYKHKFNSVYIFLLDAFFSNSLNFRKEEFLISIRISFHIFGPMYFNER